jgi:hypothetical protein
MAPADALERAKWAAREIGLTIRKEWSSGFRASLDFWKPWPYTLTIDVTESGNGSALAAALSMAKIGVSARLEDRWASFSALTAAPFG